MRKNTMTSRERIRAIFSDKAADRPGFWLGHPHVDSWPGIHSYFNTSAEEEVYLRLGDDIRWIAPWNAYKHPEGRPVFEMKPKSRALSADGVFCECESVQEVEDYPWPNPQYLDFSANLSALQNAGDFYRAGGSWSSFFHEVAAFFGMESYFVKMYTHPQVVHAVTRHVVDFHLEMNQRLFSQARGLVDGFFFGNDFGTQLDLLVSPSAFEEFIFPYFRELTNLGHEHGLQVILHSCGSIYKVIPNLIELGVNALHPLQARAANMDAETLGGEFKGKVAFMGGIDTQHLLIHATPAQVKDEVRRVKDLLGPCVVISPSHECILPNIPPRNLEAMAGAAHE